VYALRQITSDPSFLHADGHVQLLVVALVISSLDNRNGVTIGLPTHLVRRLKSMRNAAAQLIFNLRRSDHIADALFSSHSLLYPGALRLQDRRANVQGAAWDVYVNVYVIF